MPYTFERAKLYEEVWSQPLTALATKYGLSDNGLRKICKVLGIPLPKAGHWAKVAAGHKVGRLALSRLRGPDHFYSAAAQLNAAPRHKETNADDDVWLQNMLRAEEEQAALSALAATQDASHKFAELLRRRVQEGEALQAKWIAELDHRRRTGRPVWHSDAPRLLQRPSASDRGIIPAAPSSGFPFEVSSLTVKRALSIANALAIGAQARGIKSTLSPTGTWTLEIGSVAFTLRLREVQTLRAVELEGPLAALGPITRYRPTDRLALLVYRPRGEAIRLSDGAKRLEAQLDNLFPKLYRAVVAHRQSEREARQQAAERAAFEERMRVQAIQREDEAKARLLAAEREAKLLQEAMRWQQAELLRAYATAAQGRVPEYEVWRDWVLQVASRLDPLPAGSRESSRAPLTEGQ